MDMSTLDDTELKVLLQKYLVILACKFVDDESSFIKHLQKQANANNLDAIDKLTVIKQMDALFQHLHKQISDFGILGYQRIAQVCTAITLQNELPFTVSRNWVVCSLSGINTNHSCVLKIPEQTLYLDYHYLQFASKLWLVAHMSEMEYSRVNNFLADSNASDSIKQIMKNYLATDTFQGNDTVNMYLDAFTTVFQVFEHTQTQIKTEVCGHPDHPSRV